MPLGASEPGDLTSPISPFNGGTGGVTPYAPAYVLATKHNNRQRLQIGISTDGKDWTMLRLNGSPDLYAPPNGDDLRDPSIIRLGDTWFVAYTSGDYGSAHIPPTSANFGNGENYFGIAKSTDLLNWTHVANVAITGSTQTWSPRFFIDQDGSVMIYVSINGTMKYILPTDDTLAAWGSATSFVGLPAGPESDIVRRGDTYYFTAIESDGNTRSTPKLYTARQKTGPWSSFKTGNFTGLVTAANSAVEGPMMVHLGGRRWRCYAAPYDGGTERPLTVVESYDDFTTWTAQVDCTHDITGDNITHGTVLRATPIEQQQPGTILPVHIRQLGAVNPIGLKFTGTGLVGGTDDGKGIGFLLGYNDTNNRQFWLGPTDGVGTTKVFVRFQVGDTAVTLDTITGDQSTTGPLNFGAGIQIGGGANIKLARSATAALTYTSIAAGAEQTQTVAISGLATTSTPSVHLGWAAALPDGIVVKQVWVSSAATVSVRLANITAGAIVPGTLTARVTTFEF